jgi:hypothetical protein
MSSHDLQKHLNQRVTIRLQNFPGTIPGVVKLVDGTTLTLRRLVTVPGRDTIQGEDVEIDCQNIISILPEKWQ